MERHWTSEALCADYDLKTNEDIFYTNKTDLVDKAKQICNDCPVRMLCLQDAMENKERFGIRGAVEPSERRRALSINVLGEPIVDKYRIVRCPNCGPHSTRYLKVLTRKRTKTTVECSKCSLTWELSKRINKSENNW